MQSDIAQALIAKHHGEGYNVETLLLYKNDCFYERGDAVLEITRELPGCGVLFRIARITPKPIRDSVYRIIARHRYRIFGKRDQCMVPTQDMQNRFIES